MNSTASLAIIIRNDEELYRGDLVHYFRTVFSQAQNLLNPYHNFRHMSYVLRQCYDACKFYQRELTPESARALLIAAMFHDFDHSGMMGNDDLNIERAIRSVHKYVIESDRLILGEIINLIKLTEFPYLIPHKDLNLSGLIIRDADMTQALGINWMQDVILGLASEWRKEPAGVLCRQEGFLSQLKFHTRWAQELFPQTEIDAKVQEIQYLSALIKG